MLLAACSVLSVSIHNSSTEYTLNVYVPASTLEIQTLKVSKNFSGIQFSFTEKSLLFGISKKHEWNTRNRDRANEALACFDSSMYCKEAENKFDDKTFKVRGLNEHICLTLSSPANLRQNQTAMLSLSI